VAISVALAINQQVVLGVIYNPVLNNLYSAIQGKGAFKNGRPIQCSKQKGWYLFFLEKKYLIFFLKITF
jgi:fructose-1,6-bisphosphatase/inositol monophosphatase family enzyme